MISPLINKVSNKNFDKNSIIQSLNKQINTYKDVNEIKIETDVYVEQIYIDKMKEDLKVNLKEKGYSLEKVNLEIENKNEKEYGNINKLEIQIAKIEKNKKDNYINEIEEVKINISQNQKNVEEKLSLEEIKTLKEYLKTTYSVEEKNILINKQ